MGCNQGATEEPQSHRRFSSEPNLPRIREDFAVPFVRLVYCKHCRRRGGMFSRHHLQLFPLLFLVVKGRSITSFYRFSPFITSRKINLDLDFDVYNDRCRLLQPRRTPNDKDACVTAFYSTYSTQDGLGSAFSNEQESPKVNPGGC